MEFKLNEYHRNTPDEVLLNDVIEVAKLLKKRTLTMDEYTHNGKYHADTLSRRFGNWKNILERCGLETKGHSFILYISQEDVIKDIKRVANIYNKNTLTKKEYNVHGKYTISTLEKKFKLSWNQLLEMSGLNATLNRGFTNEDLFEEIQRIWVLLGRQPTTTDIKNGISKYSLQSYSRRFGGWRGALQAFVNYINIDELDKQGIANHSFTIKTIDKNDSVLQHTTKRDVNLRLRFKVMQRDNFKCCICGASPAKDPSVELHIDHIVSWAKGGETTVDNLQTLCSKCNLGKSDLDL